MTMSWWRWCAGLACAAWSLPGSAAEAETAGGTPTQVSLETRHEWVDQGLDDWDAVRLGVSRTGTWTRGWYGALVHESRFGLEDVGVEAGGFLPLDDRWLLQLEGAAASDAEFLPHARAEVRIIRRLPRGWLLSGAMRLARYPTEDVAGLSLDVERYAGQWRFAYGFDLARLEGARLGSHDVAVDRYYGDRNVIGVRLTDGKEASQREAGQLIATDSTAAWVRGTHWIAPQWAVDWSGGKVAQSAAYDRSWMQLGIRREF